MEDDGTIYDIGKNVEYRFSRRDYYMKTCLLVCILSVIFTIVVVMIVEPPREELGGIFDYSFTDINGNFVHLEKFHHKVILIVNVASDCGFTISNYSGLQKLHEMYKNSGQYNIYIQIYLHY